MGKKQLQIRTVEKQITQEGEITPDSLNLEEKVIGLTPSLLGQDEYPTIYLDHLVTDEEFEDALRTITTHVMQRQLHTVTVDLDIQSKIIEERNKPLEISIQELSEMFGGREVIIVGSKTETGSDINEK